MDTAPGLATSASAGLGMPGYGTWASIMSISWAGGCLDTAPGRATSASAGQVHAWIQRLGEHHEHQLGWGMPGYGTWASNISISWSGHAWIWHVGEHHEHQLGWWMPGYGTWASNISISWAGACLDAAPGRAS